MSLPDGQTDRWWAPYWQGLQKQRWDTELFVFNSRTGDTQVLNETAERIIQELSGASLDLAQLATKLCIPIESRSFRDLQSHLYNLTATGLVEKIPAGN